MMRWRILCALAGFLCLLGVGATSGYAQSLEDLRTTIDQLRQQLDLQQKRLEQLQTEQAAQQKEQKRLEQLQTEQAAQQKEQKRLAEAVQAAQQSTPEFVSEIVSKWLREHQPETATISLKNGLAVTLYGHGDLSVDGIFTGVRPHSSVNDCYDYGCPGGAPGTIITNTNLAGVSSNNSYLGVRGVYNFSDLPGWGAVLQFETLLEAASTPSEKSSLGSRDSFVGLQGPWGAIKLGKEDTPYKKSTNAFDPMLNTIGDYRSIMANTGGDLRAEFALRTPHSVWYESPTWEGLSGSVLVSPGQNSSVNDDNFALGETLCTGSSPRGSGSGWVTSSSIGEGACTDGSFGTAVSTAVNYRLGPFTAIAAYEFHSHVNRTGDEANAASNATAAQLAASPYTGPTLAPGTVGIRDEMAGKVGLGYRFGNTQLYGIFEYMKRDAPIALFDERSRAGLFFSATQFVGPKLAFSASYAHAFKAPGDPMRFDPDGQPIGPDNQADQIALMARYRFSPVVSVYLVAVDLINHDGAHYCLGPGTGGLTGCSRDANNNTVHGANILGIGSGITFDF